MSGCMGVDCVNGGWMGGWLSVWVVDGWVDGSMGS